MFVVFALDIRMSKNAEGMSGLVSSLQFGCDYTEILQTFLCR